mmetsp:Transcript_13746/g.29876  ORF Transcript_13746/g.29876 Transcript_13746/m.29876 type:complete len:208 (-) Transcript_13746:85-708(-)
MLLNINRGGRAACFLALAAAGSIASFSIAPFHSLVVIFSMRAPRLLALGAEPTDFFLLDSSSLFARLTFLSLYVKAILLGGSLSLAAALASIVLYAIAMTSSSSLASKIEGSVTLLGFVSKDTEERPLLTSSLVDAAEASSEARSSSRPPRSREIDLGLLRHRRPKEIGDDKSGMVLLPFATLRLQILLFVYCRRRFQIATLQGVLS